MVCFSVLVTLIFIVKSSCQDKEYQFRCQTKPGCTFQQCDKIPEELQGTPGFSPESYNERNEHHITCIKKVTLNKGTESGTKTDTFKCKPKHGCDFSSCDPIPPELANIDGFRPDLYRQSNQYFISCQPVNVDTKTPTGSCKTDIEALKAEISELRTRVFALEAKNMEAGPCPLEHDEKCFIAIVYNKWNTTYANAWKACQNIGAKPAGIYSVELYNKIVSYTRRLIPESRSYIEIWLGMYMRVDKNVMMDGTSAKLYVKWLSDYPKSSGTRLALRVQKIPTSENQGMLNIGQNYREMGVLCQK